MNFFRKFLINSDKCGGVSMDYRDEYKKWLESDYVDEETKKELLSIKNDDEEIKKRFYKELEFGTAGLRGVIGAGSNRMNIYTVSKATQGLADFIVSKGKSFMERGVAISYDVRHYSDVFAERSALVLAANGIKVYLYEGIRTTPQLSFTVRELNACAGIMITASHNPREYNGYKLYWQEGSQILDDVGDPVTENFQNIKDFSEIKVISKKEALEKKLLIYIGKDLDDKYTEKVKSLAIMDDGEIDKSIKIIYTPLNGTGNIPVRRVLKERGFTDVIVVKEQELPDPDFTTVGYPNPEDVRAFKISLEYAEREGGEILIANDPDCDRLAIIVRDKNGEYIPFNGNQTGAVLIKYILERRKEKGMLSDKSMIIKSIVTGDLGKAVADELGVKTFETLTGFKNICGLENDLEGKYNFEFGYEESIGYVTGTFVRDKDAVVSTMMLAEAAAYYKKHGKTLVDVLNELYEKYGYYFENNFSIVLEGIEGTERISRIMIKYREKYPVKIKSMKLVRYMDYQSGRDFNISDNTTEPTGIPSSNVLRFFFDDGSWYAVRPSGTEPKLKVYIYVVGKTKNEAEEKIKDIKSAVMELIDSVN